MSTSTAVSIRATRAYIKAFRELSDRKGRTMADLVREAVDEKYGSEITPLLSFFESIDYKNSQSSTIKDKREMELA